MSSSGAVALTTSSRSASAAAAAAAADVEMLGLSWPRQTVYYMTDINGADELDEEDRGGGVLGWARGVKCWGS